MSDLKICVLGAGIVGSTTVLQLREEFRNASIDLIADKFYDGTTSFAAAGLFSQEGANPGGSVERTRTWLKDSYEYYENIRRLPESQEAGIRQLSGYILTGENPHITENEILKSIVPEYRSATKEELKIYPGEWNYGCYHTTLQIDPSRYLKWALNKIRGSNIRIIQEKITTFSQLVERNYDVIVNCTGIGAKVLCGDGSLYPLRGQVSVVKSPWVKNFVFAEWDTYIIPAFDHTILGGCRQYESYNTAPNHYDALSIRERCANVIPSLKNATLLEDRVGLRPFRLLTRVEQESRHVGGKNLKIVHNYGHGGCGVTLAAGTSLNAIQLVKELLTEKRSKM